MVTTLGNLNGWHLVILSVLFFIPFVLAMISIARSKTACGLEKAVWVLITLLFPLIGAILWFAIGRRSAKAFAGR